MIQFRFLGIPVRIEPMFWLVTFFLGGGLSLGAGTTKTDIIWVLMWMVIACVSILVHEYGHALTARKLSGGQHEIRLWGMGGLAYHQGGNPTRKSRLWTIAMGPGAGLALFLLTSLAVISTYGPEVLQYLVTRRVPTELSESFLSVVTTQPPLFRIFSMLIWINLWWSLINLLPVFPLDGGQLFSTWTGKTLLAYKIGVGVGSAVALFSLLRGELYIGVLFGFLAYQNYKNLQNFQGSNGWR